MSRTIRKPYTKSKRFDKSCRSHGGCPWCRQNRKHPTLRRAGIKSHRRPTNPKNDSLLEELYATFD